MSHRRLPHRYEAGVPLFVTFNLHGVFAGARFPAPHQESAGKAFLWMDRYLDAAREGPQWLRQPKVADEVAGHLATGVDLGHYELGAWVVMPNHCHLLLLPLVDPSRLLLSLKSTSARSCNVLLGRQGPFWQREPYDHLVRTPEAYQRIAAYIEENPVRAGLCRWREEWRWSSAWRGGEGARLGVSAAR